MSIRFKYLAGTGAAMALLLWGQQAAAFTLDREASEPCCNPCSAMCGDWEIGAHALYFTPITCPHAYATVFINVVAPNFAGQNGQTQLIPCRADWGFRVFGNYLDGCIFVGVSYQWFEVTTTRSVVAVAPQQVRIQGGSLNGSGTATGQIGIEYQNVDVRVGTYWWRGSGPALYLYGNARWVDLSYRRTARVLFTDGRFEDVREKSQLEGGALGIGFGGEYDIWCGAGAFIDGNVLGVIGKRALKDVRYRRIQPFLFNDVRESYPSETCVIPEVDVRIGINYTYACGCWELVGEIGYEVDYFWHGSVFPDLTGLSVPNAPGQFVPVCEDIGFSGLFFGARFIF